MHALARRISRVLARTTETLACLIMIVVTALNLTQVGGRYLFNSGFSWTEEAMRYGMIWLMMLGSVGRPESLDAAKAYIDVIAPIRPLFVEEPIQPGDTPAMADLARRVDCPLATGERLFTPREFLDLAERRAVAYVQPDLAHCGGLSGGRRIAAIAEAANMGVAPHNPMGPVAGAVALHFDVAIPNFVIQEEAVGVVPWFEEICSSYPLALKEGAWQVPTSPGLGIELDENAAARYPFEQEQIPALDAVLADGRIANW